MNLVQGAARPGHTPVLLADLLQASTPVTWLANPAWFGLEPARVDVELAGCQTGGMTVCEIRVPCRAQPNAQVAAQVGSVAVMAWGMRTLRGVLARGEACGEV